MKSNKTIVNFEVSHSFLHNFVTTKTIQVVREKLLPEITKVNGLSICNHSKPKNLFRSFILRCSWKNIKKKISSLQAFFVVIVVEVGWGEVGGIKNIKIIEFVV